MKKRQTFFLVAILIAMIVFAGACTSGTEESTKQPKGLAEAYADAFPIGVAIRPHMIYDDYKDLVHTQFNSITAENDMKFESLQPLENQFNWGPADSIVAFVEAEGKLLRGHTLVWHWQTPDWVFEDENGNPASRELLLQRMKTHIDSVMNHFKGKVYAWDVVNEVLSDDSTEFLRQTKWLEIIGEDYIEKAFEYAHAADPDAKLFLNEVNITWDKKRNGLEKLLTRLQEKNIPIHGVGLQGHWGIKGPKKEDIQKTLDLIASYDLDVEITEIDVSLFDWEFPFRDAGPADTISFSAELEQQQIEAYKSFFEVFLANKDIITNVTFWGIADRNTWLDELPVKGRKNYPLLFDENLEPKKAYQEVINLAGNEK